MVEIEYVYDDTKSPHREEILDLVKKLQKKFDVKSTDATQWSEKEKQEFYYSRLIPISVLKKKRLRGVVRTHKAGGIYFHDLILYGGDFYPREEAVKKLRELEKKT
jgi:hypothetical protein